MSRKENFMFDTEGNFYHRITGGKCADCELPSNYCSRVKCMDGKTRVIWKKDNEMYTEFLKSQGLIEEKPIELEETQFDENGNLIKIENNEEEH